MLGDVFDDRLLNIRWDKGEDGTYTTPRDLPLTNNPGHGTSGRYEIEAQRRGDNGPVAVVRITDHETGRRLTICGNGGNNDSNVNTPTHRLIGHNAGQALHSKTFPRTQTALGNLIDFAWGYGLRRTDPRLRPAELMLAAYGLTGPAADAWLDHPLWGPYLRQRPNRIETVAELAATGVEPTQAWQFLAEVFAEFRPQEAEADRWDFDMSRPVTLHVGALLRAGMTGQEAAAIARTTTGDDRVHSASVSLLTKTAVPLAWTRVPADLRLLAVRAGLSAAEAVRMHRAGELHRESLQLIVGLT